MHCHVEMHVELSAGDLLESHVGQRHGGVLLTIAKAVFPRYFIRRFFPNLGLFLLITAQK